MPQEASRTATFLQDLLKSTAKKVCESAPQDFTSQQTPEMKHKTNLFLTARFWPKFEQSSDYLYEKYKQVKAEQVSTMYLIRKKKSTGLLFFIQRFNENWINTHLNVCLVQVIRIIQTLTALCAYDYQFTFFSHPNTHINWQDGDHIKASQREVNPPVAKSQRIFFVFYSSILWGAPALASKVWSLRGNNKCWQGSREQLWPPTLPFLCYSLTC